MSPEAVVWHEGFVTFAQIVQQFLFNKNATVFDTSFRTEVHADV